MLVLFRKKTEVFNFGILVVFKEFLKVEHYNFIFQITTFIPPGTC